MRQLVLRPLLAQEFEGTGVEKGFRYYSNALVLIREVFEVVAPKLDGASRASEIHKGGEREGSWKPQEGVLLSERRFDFVCSPGCRRLDAGNRGNKGFVPVCEGFSPPKYGLQN